MSNVTFDLRENQMEVHQTMAEPWRITLVDTGLDTQTGGRLKRIAEYVAGEDFCCTYGDGVADVDITALVDFHRSQGRLATVTAVQPPGRFGALQIEGDEVTSFLEKPHGDGNWINGGFFVLSPKVLDDIEGDDSLFEQGPLGRCRRPEGAWRSFAIMDSGSLSILSASCTSLRALGATGNAPWRID